MSNDDEDYREPCDAVQATEALLRFAETLNERQKAAHEEHARLLVSKAREANAPTGGTEIPIRYEALVRIVAEGLSEAADTYKQNWQAACARDQAREPEAKAMRDRIAELNADLATERDARRAAALETAAVKIEFATERAAREKAEAKAASLEADWVGAKYEFGTHIKERTAERDAALARVQSLEKLRSHAQHELDKKWVECDEQRIRAETAERERDEAQEGGAHARQLLTACRVYNQRETEIVQKLLVERDEARSKLAASESARSEAEAGAAALREALGKTLDALVWCSGSYDFAPEGRAGEGWAKLGLPALTAGFACLRDIPTGRAIVEELALLRAPVPMVLPRWGHGREPAPDEQRGNRIDRGVVEGEMGRVMAKRKPPRRVWVVEQWYRGGWLPCIGLEGRSFAWAEAKLIRGDGEYRVRVVEYIPRPRKRKAKKR